MKKLFILLFPLIVSISNAQVIPIERTTDWSNSGYPGSIPQPLLVLNVMDFGAAADGVTNDAPSIRSAIDSLHGRQGVIFLPAGNYLINSTLDIPDSVIIRGVSNDSTHLIFNFGGLAGNGFNITGGISGIFTPATDGLHRGSNWIVVQDASTFHTGDYAELFEDNGAWDIVPEVWATNCVGQILYLTSINGDTLFFDAPLRMYYDQALSPRIQKITPAAEVGIECLSISRGDDVSTGLCYNIYFNYAANCWIRGVESSISVGSHIDADASTNISIQGCYIHHSYQYDGVSTHGYGITLFARTGQCRVENNIMQHLRHAFSMQTGANGNVIAYNYCYESTRTEFPADFSADISLHGHFPYSNLFEGNIVQNIQIDVVHGPSGPFNTFFRNRAEKYGIYMSSASYQSDSMNFAGNEVPDPNFPFGNYTLTGSAHFEFGNNIHGTILPVGTTTLNDSSYYLQGFPAFWTSSTFPSIGIPNSTASGTNPAYDRVIAGNFVSECDDSLITVQEIKLNTISFFPNPSLGIIHLINPESFEGVLILKDLNGKSCFECRMGTASQRITVPAEIKNGFYLLEFISGKMHSTKKFVLLRE